MAADAPEVAHWLVARFGPEFEDVVGSAPTEAAAEAEAARLNALAPAGGPRYGVLMPVRLRVTGTRELP